MNKKLIYQVFIEGELSAEFKTRAAAMNFARQSENEGWGVKVLTIYPTIIGSLGVAL